MVIISSAKNHDTINKGYISIAVFLNTLIHIGYITSFGSNPSWSIFENKGNKTVEHAPTIIPMKGNSINPLLKSAKTSSPKYRLIKNWSADLIIIPQKLAIINGKENLKISLYVTLVLFFSIPLNGRFLRYIANRKSKEEATTNPKIACIEVPLKTITGNTTHNIMKVREHTTYIEFIYVFLYVEYIASIPIVGNMKNGTIANIRSAVVKSGLLRISAIVEAPVNKINEKKVPIMKKSMVILNTKLCPSSNFTRGKKYPYAFGSPKVKTNNKVL